MNIHDHSSPDIIQFGPYRSGSTFIFQYLKQLFPDKKILKYHAYREENVPVIITVRDFRDSVASYWRIEYPLKNDRKIEIGKDFMTKEDIDFYSESYFRVNDDYHKYIKTHDKCLVIRYEDFFNNFNYLHNQMEQFFNIEISPNQRLEIESKCNLEHNKKLQAKFENFSSYDIVTGIHGDHIFTGESLWEKVIPENLKDYLNNKLKILLDEWKY